MMTTITLEVPEELAMRLDPLRDQLPELLSQLLDSVSTKKKFALRGAVMTHPVFLELFDFLSARPTAKQILAHKVSSAMQERLEELLDKNREEGLTTSEEEEMDAYRLVNLRHDFTESPQKKNLALACMECNLRKGPDLTAIDPVERVLAPLFNPRMQRWTEHFTLVGASLVGETPTGRATNCCSAAIERWLSWRLA